jgi:hypothetical protein
MLINIYFAHPAKYSPLIVDISKLLIIDQWNIKTVTAEKDIQQQKGESK